MHIDAKLANGYVILCDRTGEDHVFIVRNLGPSVECPKCGSTALSGDLATEFVRHRRDQAQSPDQAAPASVAQAGPSSPGDHSRPA